MSTSSQVPKSEVLYPFVDPEIYPKKVRAGWDHVRHDPFFADLLETYKVVGVQPYFIAIGDDEPIWHFAYWNLFINETDNITSERAVDMTKNSNGKRSDEFAQLMDVCKEYVDKICLPNATPMAPDYFSFEVPMSTNIFDFEVTMSPDHVAPNLQLLYSWWIYYMLTVWAINQKDREEKYQEAKTGKNGELTDDAVKQLTAQKTKQIVDVLRRRLRQREEFMKGGSVDDGTSGIEYMRYFLMVEQLEGVIKERVTGGFH